jgi:phosphoglycolate phosphatase
LGLQEALQKAVPELRPEDYPRMIERYRHYYFSKDEDLVLFDGVREMLKALRKDNYFLAIATGKSRAGLDRALYSVELTDIFDSTRCADETFSKPHPAMLHELTRDLGMEMSRTVMIGDTTHDLQMALNAGAAGVAVHYGAHRPEELKMMEPLYAADSVPELHAWLSANA